MVRLVELAISKFGRFAERGVWLCVNELEAIGQPIERIRVWATLHFLPAGSPYDSDDPDLWVWPLKDETAEFLRVQMGLVQSVRLEWVAVRGVVHPGVEFVGNGGHRV
jgi:hypothetical protein